MADSMDVDTPAPVGPPAGVDAEGKTTSAADAVEGQGAVIAAPKESANEPAREEAAAVGKPADDAGAEGITGGQSLKNSAEPAEEGNQEDAGVDTAMEDPKQKAAKPGKFMAQVHPLAKLSPMFSSCATAEFGLVCSTRWCASIAACNSTSSFLQTV